MVEVNDEILKKVLENITITPEGNLQWQGNQRSEYKRYLLLLLSDITSNKQFQLRLNKLRYYFGSYNDPFVGFEFHPIFKEMKLRNGLTFANFKDRLDRLLEEIKQSSKPERFDLYYPLNIKTDRKIGPLNLDDILIEIKDYDEIKGILESRELNDKFKNQKLTKHKYKYIKIIVWARNENYAVYVGNKYLHLILGFIVYSENYRIERTTELGIPKSITKIKPNFIFSFKENAFLSYYFFDDKSDNEEIYDLTEEDIMNLNTFITQFNQANKHTKNVLLNVFSSYYSGSSEKKLSFSFLNFWIALEAATLKRKGLRHIEIIRRLKALLKLLLLNLTALENHRIDRIYTLRNKLVHEGDDAISQYDRNLIKTYSEIAIEFFIFDLVKFTPREINQIFEFIQKDQLELAKSKVLIDFVINLRERAKNANNNN